MPEKFQNGGFTLKTHPHYAVTTVEYRNITFTGQLKFVIEKHLARDIKKLLFRNVFCPNQSEQPAFSNSSWWNNVFKKICFRDGLVWTAGLIA